MNRQCQYHITQKFNPSRIDNGITSQINSTALIISEKMHSILLVLLVFLCAFATSETDLDLILQDVCGIQHCIKCNYQKQLCLACSEGYGLPVGGGKFCTQCQFHAKICEGLIAHCTRAIRVGPSTKCIACEKGWGVPFQGGSACVPCPEHADVCVGLLAHCTRAGINGVTKRVMCLACEKGWGVHSSGGYCTKCLNNVNVCECLIPHCTRCINTPKGDYCLDCEEGWYQINGKCAKKTALPDQTEQS
eukprot:TRINITY_DN64429_c0_g1_i1.p2 TRINITY_DN64429_c0_g1~~TRINITY_DN64429_c0_g1_i1.p2  ORF type:complete len:275 (+),score=-15.96 TRINITY_DN64429_c0_g1_i1:82-825(+)